VLARVTGLAAELGEAQMQAIEESVRDKLKDPNSAIISDIQTMPDKKIAGLIYVCGLVNAKNSFGGYTNKAVFLGGLAPPEATTKKRWVFVVAGIDDAGKPGGAKIECGERGMRF
jgi:hypothetical protein